jgi:hypothetical protein
LTELVILVVALVGFSLFYGLGRLAERSPHTAGTGRSAWSRTGGNRRQQERPRRRLCHYETTDAYEESPVEQRLLGPPGVVRGVQRHHHLHAPVDLPHRRGVRDLVHHRDGAPLRTLRRGLEEHYGPQVDRKLPRLLLASALLGGWALAALFAPTHALTANVLTAFLAGSVLLNVFKEEIPTARRSSFTWFMLGLVGYGVLLGLITMVRA